MESSTFVKNVGASGPTLHFQTGLSRGYLVFGFSVHKLVGLTTA